MINWNLARRLKFLEENDEAESLMKNDVSYSVLLVRISGR